MVDWFKVGIAVSTTVTLCSIVVYGKRTKEYKELVHKYKELSEEYWQQGLQNNYLQTLVKQKDDQLEHLRESKSQGDVVLEDNITIGAE